MTLTKKIARALYIEGCEAEDGDVVWESPEDIRAEIEGWERFAEAVTAVVREHLASDEAVEAGARAWANSGLIAWDDTAPAWQQMERENMRAGLAAAIGGEGA